MTEPVLMEGSISLDDRGEVGFVNGFTFDKVKRFYSVCNHKPLFVRAWHAHKHEAKYVTAVQGAALIAAVRIDNWDNPSRDGKVFRYVLSDRKPSVLYIPAGYANGFMNLTDDAKLIFFSTSSIEESRGDDFRYDARHWDPWQVVER